MSFEKRLDIFWKTLLCFFRKVIMFFSCTIIINFSNLTIKEYQLHENKKGAPLRSTFFYKYSFPYSETTSNGISTETSL